MSDPSFILVIVMIVCGGAWFLYTMIRATSRTERRITAEAMRDHARRIVSPRRPALTAYDQLIAGTPTLPEPYTCNDSIPGELLWLEFGISFDRHLRNGDVVSFRCASDGNIYEWRYDSIRRMFDPEEPPPRSTPAPLPGTEDLHTPEDISDIISRRQSSFINSGRRVRTERPYSVAQGAKEKVDPVGPQPHSPFNRRGRKLDL